MFNKEKLLKKKFNMGNILDFNAYKRYRILTNFTYKVRKKLYD